VDCNEVLELISSAVDERLEKDTLKNFYQHTNVCKICRNVFELESITKKFIQTRVQPIRTPDYLADRLISQIKNSAESRSSYKINSILSLILQWRKWYVAIPAIAAIGLYFIIFSPPAHHYHTSPVDNNIIHQIYNNYDAVVDGKIKPTLTTDDPSVLENYLKENVNYNVNIPKLRDCVLVGGTVSQFDEEKLSHIIYKHGDCIIYFSLIDFRVVVGNRSITLPQKAIDELVRTGWYYADDHKCCSVILWLKDSTLYIAAAEMEKDKLMAYAKEGNKNNINDSKSIDNVFTLKNVTHKNDHSLDFEWDNNSGNANNFKSFHSKLTIINFWATWCGPCRKELPDLVAISNEFATKGVRVIGISTDRGSNVVADVSEFINKNKVTYPIVIDNGELAKAFGNVRGIPTTFLVNEEGKVVESFMGLRTKEFFVEKINRLLQ